VDAYNSFISFECTRHQLAYVDINTYFKSLSTGFTFNGITYNTDFVTDGAFSLDGIHPTQRGYALFTNEVIKAINEHYKSSLLPIDANKYKGIEFP
jgi:lysophospholipase L1-like esterase